MQQLSYVLRKNVTVKDHKMYAQRSIYCGVYMIRNKINNKVYIGSSKNIKQRISKHKLDLKKNNHFNKHLQRSWNKYGKDNFEFIILKIVDEDIRELEEYELIKKLEALDFKKGYNQEAPFKSVKMSDEQTRNWTKKKMKNYKEFSLTNKDTNEVFVFDYLEDAAKYIKDKGLSNAKIRNIKMILSDNLRKSNTAKNKIGKFTYNHILKIIN